MEGADTPIDTLIEAPLEPAAGPDPFGNLSRQVVEQGFALGVDLFFVLDTPQLVGSGIPRKVLEEQREQLRLRMEARWFSNNKARFLDEAMVCMLSFDSLVECTLPWSAFRSITFLLPAEAHIPQSPEPAPTRPAPPFLRIVK